jgi:hypothetical protein
MAANQAIKDAPALRERFPSLPGWVNYLPVVLVLIGGGLWVDRKFIAAAPTAGAISPTPITGSALPTAPLPPNLTDYVSGAVATKFLALSKREPTPLQIDLLLHPYIGKRMRLSGTLDTVTILDHQHIQVQMSPIGGYGGSIFVEFPSKWTAQLSLLGRDSTLNVDTLISAGEPTTKLTDGQLF